MAEKQFYTNVCTVDTQSSPLQILTFTFEYQIKAQTIYAQRQRRQFTKHPLPMNH